MHQPWSTHTAPGTRPRTCALRVRAACVVARLTGGQSLQLCALCLSPLRPCHTPARLHRLRLLLLPDHLGRTPSDVARMAELGMMASHDSPQLVWPAAFNFQAGASRACSRDSASSSNRAAGAPAGGLRATRGICEHRYRDMSDTASSSSNARSRVESIMSCASAFCHPHVFDPLWGWRKTPKEKQRSLLLSFGVSPPLPSLLLAQSCSRHGQHLQEWSRVDALIVVVVVVIAIAAAISGIATLERKHS